MNRVGATKEQIRAASPADSTWLSANAGSGKTRVLTDRVARLLLSGVSPQNILCLTYTKAAASEMQNRLFKRLGEWAMKDDGDLTDALRGLGVEGTGDLRRARQLFARAIETPGGLRIQTIHSFCAALLRRFPLESGVPPQFVEMDDRATRILREEVVEDMADGPLGAAVAGLARFYTGTDFDALTREIADRRQQFSAPVNANNVWHWFGLPPGFGTSDLSRMVFTGGEAELLQALIPILSGGSPTDITAADKLAAIDTGHLDETALELLEKVFLFGAKAAAPFGAKIGRFPTKATRDGSAAALIPALEDFMLRVERTRETRISLYSGQKTMALHEFASPFIREYQARKLTHGWLDFDDLIQKAAALLNDPAVATWVLYRLDGGLDHILVDEAQDTNPAQWRVIESLTREFTSGQGARPDEKRTLFVVGDPKQSIYSFQGADPGEFTRMRDRFSERLEQIGDALHPRVLAESFRSAPAILGLVDFTLAGKPGLGDEFLHHAHFGEKPGRVDLWPVVEATDALDTRNWHDPVDQPAPENHDVRLARGVADEIRRMLKFETIQGQKGKTVPVQPGDVLILVQRRSVLFHEVIRACKELNLPIAGADQLRIGGELAVKDLTALLSFLATPEDDLSLAAALRSPLFGHSEADLYDLAHDRAEKYLWRSLSARSDRFGDTISTLTALRNDADFLRPYDLLERILTRFNGRWNLLARLGIEAEDGIDALLSQALAYERLETPSLTGFLMWLEADEVKVKRQMDSAGNRIRVMTVHGAKGLESPIVFLPDCRKVTPPARGGLIEISPGQVVWKPGADQLPENVRAAVERQKAAEAAEWIRLLYVAMTRAEQWLIVAAAGEIGDGDGSWYRIVEQGMAQAGAVARDFALGRGHRYQTGNWGLPPSDRDQGEPPAPDDLPDWAGLPAGTPAPAPRALAPSNLGGAKALAGEIGEADPDAALKRGRQLHRLLEFLPGYPEPVWRRTGASLLAFGEDAASPEELPGLLDEAAGVLGAPALAQLFGPDALAEVDVTAAIPVLGQARIHGAVDRLLVQKDRVLAVDFKSNAIVPATPGDTPEGILRQMGAYQAALARIFPDRIVETAILWTRPATLMPLPNDLVAGAIRRLDDPTAGS